MHLPALVGGCGEAASEQVLFVLAQPSNAFEFFEQARSFFFHSLSLQERYGPVEPLFRLGRRKPNAWGGNPISFPKGLLSLCR